MKNKIIKIVACVLAAVLIYKIYVYIPNIFDLELSDYQLKANINRIARENSNIFASCKIWGEKEKWRFENDDIQEIDEMTKGQIIIYISGSDGIYRNTSCREVYGIFESWLYVKSRQTKSDVAAICWSYVPEGIYTTTDRTTVITKNEFDRICSMTNISGLKRSEAAKVLAKKWIDETGYTKN